jgi:DnaJ family protein C protein 2
MTTLQLPAVPASFKKESEVYLGLGGYFKTKQVAPVGRAYYRRVKLASRGRSASCESLEDADKERHLVRKEEEKILAKYRKSIKGKNFLELTMYEQLGLTEYGFDVSEEQIKKMYHRVLIEHHPDKTGKTENDPNYLAVQKAFDTLMDPKKKRAYDSQCDFDEWIPNGTEKILENDGNGKSFYDLYGQVFESNARFSQTQPVPKIGNDSTPLEEVYAFYDFWHQFDSWRDFTFNAEHDVDSAEARDHKRWMAKKNETAAKKLKKKEYLRLCTLIDRAFQNDPRLRRIKEEEKKKKEFEKKQKEEEKKRLLDEEKQKEEEKKRVLEEKEEKQKQQKQEIKFQKEKQKKLFRKIKKAFRELMVEAKAKQLEGAIDVIETETICDALEMEELQQLVDAMGGGTETKGESTLNTFGLKKVQETLTKLMEKN